MYLFIKIYENINIEENSSIKLKTYTVEFEFDLINALKEILKKQNLLNAFPITQKL